MHMISEILRLLNIYFNFTPPYEMVKYQYENGNKRKKKE